MNSKKELRLLYLLICLLWLVVTVMYLVLPNITSAADNLKSASEARAKSQLIYDEETSENDLEGEISAYEKELELYDDIYQATKSLALTAKENGVDITSCRLADSFSPRELGLEEEGAEIAEDIAENELADEQITVYETQIELCGSYPDISAFLQILNEQNGVYAASVSLSGSNLNRLEGSLVVYVVILEESLL